MKLSEDWLATGIGLVIVVVIGAGLLGPGPLEVKLTAQPGETAQVEAQAVGGWRYSATLDGDTVAVALPDGDLTRLEPLTRYRFVCREEGIRAEAPVVETASLPDPSQAVVILENTCDAPAALTVRRDYVIRWPLFDLFAR